MDDMTILLLVAIVILMVIAAFFSGAETALISATRAQILQMEKRGDARATLVKALRKDRERLIAAILLGNSLVNVLAAALATGLLVGLYGPIGVLYATLAMTVLLVVFSEILPKTYALQNAVPSALALARPLRVVVAALSPVASGLRLIATGLLRLFGKSGATATLVTPTQALRGAIDVLAQDAGGEIDQERKMLHSILELDEVEVGEVMVHRQNVTMIDIDAPLDEIMDRIAASPFTRLPIWRDRAENIIGVLHVKALLQLIRKQPQDWKRIDLLSLAAEPWFVPEQTSLLEQLQAFRRRREHFAVVVDEYGAVLGIVTLEDILEEIVGDIADEHDVVARGVRPTADGAVVIEGTVTIRDLNRQFGWALPDAEAATIAGLVLHESRQIPEVGQMFLFHDFRFEILRRQRNQITLLKIAPQTADSAQEAAEVADEVRHAGA
ncbi:MAG TPA: HlyC/CorC family transporter [Alphaproteobacteria bacterium]|jgi:Mg2+/Co2+ transporter CorB